MSEVIVDRVSGASLTRLPFESTDILGGNPIQRVKVLFETSAKQMAGIWECSPGAFKEDPVKQNETFAIYQGSATIRLGNGKATPVGAGDVVTIPQGSSAFWEVKETIRKAFVKY